MVWGLVAAGASMLIGGMQRSNERAQNRAYAEAAAKRQNAIAKRTWHQQLKTIQQQYLNQVRQRNWDHWQALGQFGIDEIDRAAGARLNESKLEFEYAATEIGRRIKYDLEAIAYDQSRLEDRDAYAQRVFETDLKNKQGFAGVEQNNFDVEMRFLADEQRKLLNDLELSYLEEMEDLDDKTKDSIAIQRYNISIGEIAGDVFQAQVKGNKLLRKNEREALERFGQRLALGQTGNSVTRLLTDIAIDKAGVEAEVLNEMDASVGAGIVAEAKAKLRLAEELRRDFRNPKRVSPIAVMGQRAKWFDLPKLQPYREMPDIPKFLEGPGIVHARHIPGVAPIRGPEVPLPDYPEEPIYVTADEIMGGSGGSGLIDALGTAFDIGKLVFNHMNTPAVANPYAYKSGSLRISDSFSANNHPMGGGLFN